MGGGLYMRGHPYDVLVPPIIEQPPSRFVARGDINLIIQSCGGGHFSAGSGSFVCGNRDSRFFTNNNHETRTSAFHSGNTRTITNNGHDKRNEMDTMMINRYVL